MLIDSNLVSIDSAELSGTITPVAIPLTSLYRPGRMERPLVCVQGSKDCAGGTSVTIGFQQADEENGTFAAVGPTFVVPLADLQKGIPVGPRFLPREIVKPWVKITATKQGSFSNGTLFAAVVREDVMPYDEGMYIDRGEVQG